MLNLDDRVWQCAFHRDTLAIARHFLGSCRVVEACSKPCWPGAPAQALHVDSAHHFHQVPDVPWMINTIWMLSDFTVENGATGIVPLSHRSRLKTPPPEVGHDSEFIAAVAGEAGSVLLWHGGAWHQARANTLPQQTTRTLALTVETPGLSRSPGEAVCRWRNAELASGVLCPHADGRDHSNRTRCAAAAAAHRGPCSP